MGALIEFLTNLINFFSTIFTSVVGAFQGLLTFFNTGSTFLSLTLNYMPPFIQGFARLALGIAGVALVVKLCPFVG